eukprot:TRINITY_DN10725_c0_g1_i1.p1 TRINITY_DN10725_c0_g1~~TRINITY_DN10725_c0_g1_i1.p1  ORF type:complete len:359 (+),score=68.56 TRINITY_DN10725_c0_g1_i1:38-1114(+)
MNTKLYFIFIFLYITLTNSTLTSIQFGIPQCNVSQNNTECFSSMSLSVNLDHLDTKFKDSWSYYFDEEGTKIYLNSSVTVDIEILPTLLNIPVEYYGTFYNVYEEFIYEQSCPLAFNFGNCQEDATKPPSDTLNSENYSLCCLSDSKIQNNENYNISRGPGIHCLRYDYNEKYESYNILSNLKSVIVNYVYVSITKDETNEEFVLTSIGDDSKSSSFYQANLILSNREVKTPLDFLQQPLIFNKYGKPDSFNDWFVIDRVDDYVFNRLNLTALEYKDKVDCNDPLNSVTKTHDLSNPKDQYQSFKKNTFNSISPNIIEEVIYIDEQGDHDEGFRRGTIELNYDDKSTNYFITLLIEDV